MAASWDLWGRQDTGSSAGCRGRWLRGAGERSAASRRARVRWSWTRASLSDSLRYASTSLRSAAATRSVTEGWAFGRSQDLETRTTSASTIASKACSSIAAIATLPFFMTTSAQPSPAGTVRTPSISATICFCSGGEVFKPKEFSQDATALREARDAMTHCAVWYLRDAAPLAQRNEASVLPPGAQSGALGFQPCHKAFLRSDSLAISIGYV